MAIRNRKEEIVEEVKKQLWLGGPLFMVGLLQYSLQVISLMFVGHLGDLPLAGSSLATSFASVTGFTLLVISLMFVGHLGDLPLAGSSLATSFASVIGFTLLVISLMFVGHLGDLPLAGSSLATSFASVTGFTLLEIVEEVKKQLWLGGSLFMMGLLQYSLQVISLMFVGHLGDLPLAGSSLATSFASVTGFTLLLGLASGLDTLCGQCFGAKQYPMLGIHIQRAMLVLSLASILLCFIWANTEHILISLRQNPEISKVAGVYARFLIPSLLPFGLLQCLVKFLQTQNNVYPMMVTSVVTAALHIVVCWVLVFKSGLGTKGAALANSISYWINVLTLAGYVKFSSSCARSWNGFSKEAFCGIPNFLRIAVPSALMLCLKVWSFEVAVILSGLLPNPTLETSVLSICLNTFNLVWMIAFGLSAAVSTRVSNELGARNPQGARLAAWVVLFLAITECTFVGLMMILLGHKWGHVYSNEQRVVRYVASMMPILAASSFLDGIQSVLSGIARGCGWQKICTYVNLASFTVLGIPSGIVFGFILHLKAKGLWLGIVCAFAVQTMAILCIMICTDWDKEVNKAASRVQSSSVHSGVVQQQEA